jgi:hypothetical protein
MSVERGPAPAGSRAHWIVWLFAIVGLLGILAIIVIAATIMGLGGPRQPARVVGETPAASLTIRDAGPLAGTNLIRIDIAAGRGRSPVGSYSGGMDDLRNILLLDRTSGAVRRLLPDNNRRIANSYFLPARADVAAVPSDDVLAPREEGHEEPPPPPAYFALLVARPGPDEGFDLMIGTLAGPEQGYAMQGFEGIDSVWMQSPTRIGLIVRERMNLYYRIVDIPTRRVILSRRIAI